MTRVALDPIPATAISISAAFSRLTEFVTERPNLDLLAEYHLDDLSAQQEKALEFVADCLDHQRECYCEIIAAWVLRLALADGTLEAFVRDPRDNTILLLNSEYWFVCIYPPFVARPFDEDWVFGPWDSVQPGPDGTLIDGEFRPVFLDGKQFDAWLTNLRQPLHNTTIGRTRSDEQVDSATEAERYLSEVATKIKATRQERSILHAIHAEFGALGDPDGLTDPRRDERINKRLLASGLKAGSESAIYRVYRKLKEAGLYRPIPLKNLDGF